MKSSSQAKLILTPTVKYASLIIAALVTAVPLVVLLLTSLKSAKDFATSGPLELPSHWTLSNYSTAWSEGGMGMAFINTTIVLVISVTASIIIGTMAAYAISRFDFRFKKVVVAAFLLAALVPSVTTQVATFQIVNNLGLFDSRKAAIVLFTSTDIVSIYIFVQFMRSIPISLDEAAKLDGCSHFTIYRRIILPLLRPAIATVIIIKGIAVYNDFYTPFLYMPDQNLGMASTSLYRFLGPYGGQWPLLSAAAIIIIIPAFVIFILLQKQIYNGISAGATK